jgi:hypothetical protein
MTIYCHSEAERLKADAAGGRVHHTAAPRSSYRCAAADMGYVYRPGGPLGIYVSLVPCRQLKTSSLSKFAMTRY